MKFWKKIFLYSVILTMVLINGLGIVMINRVHKDSLERVIKDTMDRQKNISNAIYLNYDISNDKYPYSQDRQDASKLMNIILKNYIYTEQEDIQNIQVFKQDKTLVASLNKYNNECDISDILDKKGEERFFTIKKINKERVLLVSSQLNVNNEDYKLVLLRSIEFLYEDRTENYKMFIILDVIINIMLIIGMYLISKNTTKPIADLTNVSIDIANGEYNKRVSVGNSKDEVALLSRNFNFMMEELESKIEELKNVNEEKERFINNLTHEMKTPITSIIGYSDILLRGNINPEVKLKSLDYINSEAKRLESLSSALVKLILVKNSNQDKNIISIKQCMEDVIKSISYKLKEKNINLSIDLDDINIMAEKELIIILIRNILENSVKACATNGNIKVKSKLESKGSYSISIEDNGKGISKEDLSKIMEPFYVVDKSRSRKDNGLGLGLSICKEVCNTYNIKFEITSELNVGTNVKLVINLESDSNETS